MQCYGPTFDTEGKALVEEFGATPAERVRQSSNANNWGSIAGGKTVEFESSDGNKRYLTIFILDWYNQIVKTSSDMVKISIKRNDNGIRLSGAMEIPATQGIATFNNFKIIADPDTEVELDFESDSTNNIRGATFKVKTRNCAKGEFLNLNVDKKCDECDVGKYGDETGKQTECKMCQHGRFSNTTKLTTCYSCTHGQYQDEPEKQNCKTCKQGKFTDDKTGYVICNECPAGKHGNAEGECIECTYSPPPLLF